VFTDGVAVGDAADEENPAGMEVQAYVYEPDPPEAFAASCVGEPAHILLGVAVADALNAPPVTVIVTWSELEQPVEEESAVNVNTVVANRFTVLVVRLDGLVTDAAGVQL